MVHDSEFFCGNSLSGSENYDLTNRTSHDFAASLDRFLAAGMGIQCCNQLYFRLATLRISCDWQSRNVNQIDFVGTWRSDKEIDALERSID